MTLIEERVLKFIQGHTKENRTFAPIMQREFDLQDAELRDIIRDLRRMGYPIASGYGYWYEPEDENILDHLEQRAVSEFETVRLFKANRLRALDKQPQLQLFQG